VGASCTIESRIFNMKNIITLSVLSLACGLVACGGSQPEPAPPAHEVAEERAEKAADTTDANTAKAEDAADKAETNADKSAESAEKAQKAAEETKK
jgi:hypothetical protein